MDNISEHLTYAEAIRSDSAKRLGIDNTPNGGQIERMKTLAQKVFEPIRAHFNTPVYVSSFFRSEALNKAMKGAKASQHTTGEAMDIDADVFGVITNKDIFEYIKNSIPEFDQLIWEGGTDENPDWVHVSFTYKYPNRKQILRMKVIDNKKVYEIIN